MTQKVHGFVGTPDQFLSGAVKMFQVTTSADLTTVPTNGTHNVALEKLIEAISLRAQPVIIGAVAAPGLRFAVEHNDIFGADLTELTALVKAATGDASATVAPFVF